MKHTVKFGIQYTVLLLLLFTALAGRAQVVEAPVIKALDGSYRNASNQLVNQIKKDSSIEVYDITRLGADSTKLKLNGYYRIKNIIRLKLNEDTNVVYKPNFTVTVRLKLYLTNVAGDVDSSQTPLLSITYDSAKSATNNVLSFITLYNAYRVKAKIISVDSSYVPTGISPKPSVTPFVRLENEMQITREYNYACTAPTTIGVDTTILSTTGEAIISWPAIQGAVEYDMEWAFVDNEALQDTSLYKTAGALDAKKVFANNASRVTTTSTAYRIPVIYDELGTVFVRYRPVQVRPNGQRYEGNWSSDNTGGLGQISTNTGHERTLNWQSTTSFAEESKRKTVVQYYDGTLRQRQTVTKDNTTNTTVVAETFYDFQGRAVIQVLPAPTLSTLIGYSKNFNRGINASPYDKNMYDTLLNKSDYCLNPAPAMGTDSGAAKYYSASNPLATLAYHKYIPNAQGYAFTETRYSQDNSGRVLAQSGVGNDFKIGSGRETKYFYSNPAQFEIDGVFGTEAGYASHYTKTLVRDANGQYSVSYTDMHGRTVATALAGKAPAALDTLTSYNKRTVTEKLSDSTNNLIYDRVMESSRSIMVTDSGLHTFNYTLNPDSLRSQTCNNTNICYDCLYNLQITITDECNNCHLPGQVPYVVVDSNFTFTNIDTLCNAPLGFNKTFAIGLPEGNYTVTKKLSISSFGFNYLRDSVFMKKNTCRTFNDFYKEQVDSMQSQIDCSLQTCDSCAANTSSLAVYRVYYLNTAGIPLSDSVNYSDEIAQAYADAKEECSFICGQVGEHTYIRKAMLADMTVPFGQYANPDSANTTRSFGNIFNSSNQLWRTRSYHTELGKPDSIINSLGQLVPPTDISISQDEFIANFKINWATDLLPIHPEYLKLLEYEKHTASHLWDEQFALVDTYSQADSLGYLNPAGLTGGQVPSHFTFLTSGHDPLAKQDSLLSTVLKADVYNYKTDGTYTFSMWGIASIAAKCNTNACGANYTNSSLNNNLNPSGFCTGELDMGWRAFAQNYVTHKRKELMKQLQIIHPTTIPSYRTEYFAVNDSAAEAYLATLQGMNQTQVSTEANTQMQQQYTTTCQDYASSWWTALATCNLTSADSLRLIPRMVEICVAGSDVNHPFGSSSAAPGSSLPYTSFETLVKAYIDSMATVSPGNYAWSNACNVYSIYYPTPYNNQVALGDIPVWTKPDSCQCANITTQYNNYLVTNPAPDTTSFATYLLRTTGTVMTNADLLKLRNMCSGADTCKFLESPITLPPALQCGITNVCVDCIKMQQVLDTFKIAFAGQYPAYNSDDSTQERINRNFTNFANYKLGFTKQAVDYLQFMDTCKIRYTAPYSNLFNCDTLADVQTKFINTVYPGLIWPAAYNADGCDTLKWAFQNTPLINSGKVKYQDMFTNSGIVGWPSSVTDTLPGTSSNAKLEVNKIRSICNLNGFTYEARMAAPSLPPGTGAKSLIIIVNTNRNGTFTADQFTFYSGGIVYQNVTSLPGISSFDIIPWKTYKLKYITDSIKLYVNDTLKGTVYAAGTATKINSFSNQFRLVNGKIDSIRVTLNDGTVVLNEQFNSGCDTFAIERLQNVCTVPNCQTSFVNYFNQRMGGSRTYATIDTIYSRQCGIFINPCGSSNRPILCGKTEPLFPQITIEEESPCADTASLAFVKATELYKAYQDSLKNAFEAAYLAKCMQAFKTESFTVTHPQSIYHYTLYYYDQAGNLVKTVPPAGVDLSGMLRTTWLDSVATARKNNTVLVPDHSLGTNYRYNSLNQVTEQKTPDAGISTFYYDRLGRLVISQNAKQKAESATETNRNYSYTKYDGHGRITEVGQLKNATNNSVTQTITQDTSAFKTWYTAATATGANIEMVTRTYYDNKYPVAIGTPALNPANLRNRVAYTTYTDGNGTANYNTATFYSYDVHGNVDTLLQDYGSSLITATANIMNSNAARWKRLVYRYDLISGKVNHVAYQPNYMDTTGKLVRSQDALYHRYSYDAENRLIIAETSTDSTVWQRDAQYTYYKHGPLARIVLGQRQVQGLDYAYTLQGWLKGVNSTTLSTTFDMGADGTNWQGVARDAYSFNLNYYNGDYTNISTTNTFAGIGVLPTGDLRNLYNGNITSMAVNIAKFNSAAGAAGDTALLYNYKYDQLNRLKSMDAFRGLNTTANTWTSSLTKLTAYRERISYDANGNILTYKRNGHLAATPVMDSLNYTYNAATNQLNRVQDLATSNTAYADDIDDNQAANNYTYDAIGNLITDSSENIRATAGGIKWNVYGKITEINKVDSSAGNPYNKGRVKKITYSYDAGGNRISKKVERYTNALVDYTWYVRDASGNVMSTYTYTSTTATDLLANNLMQSEVYLFGSSRLGSYTVNRNVEITRQLTDTTYGVYAGDSITKQPFIVGLKQYELSNHLGNVLVTISDKKIPVSAGGTTIDYYTADVITANDYYPFGMQMPGRKFSGAKYRYSINGQEKEAELNDNITTALYWEYDSRIGRRWNVDPKPNASISLYATFNNNPIFLTDILGDTTKYYDIKTGAELGTINNAGPMSRIKVKAFAYKSLQDQIKANKIDLNNQAEANKVVKTFNGILDKFEVLGLFGDLISRETGVKNLTFTGSYNAKTHLASGILSLNSQFDNGSSLSINQWDALSGTVARGGKVLWPLPNRNDYEGTGIQPRSAKGFVNHGIGFVLMINDFPKTNTWNRGLFRVHPDGNSPGSAGCIALQSGKDGLLLFKSLMRNYTRAHGNISLSVNIQDNPNIGYLKENEKGKKKINYGE
ncbi:hypothetical protein [Ferruginibacter sp.]|nr:hypothetical protein [Ferruginibacter sp.]